MTSAMTAVLAMMWLAGGDDALAVQRRAQRAFRAAVARAAPGVVTIETVGGAMPPDSRRGRSFQVADGPTTGLVYSRDGLILTSSFNFVRDPSVVTVTLADGRQFVASLVARDEINRLAMLRIEADGLAVPVWCPQEAVQVGTWALALGRGFGGEGPAVSVGIISAVGRFEGGAVQTDAKLSPGNYGGPLVDLQGRVIGVCVPLGPDGGEMAGVSLYDSGVGFAVPAWRIAAVGARLARGESVQPGKIGVLIQNAVPEGVRISGVARDSGAAEAGLETDDVILAVDGESVADRTELLRRMARRAAGETIRLDLLRGAKKLSRTVTLRARSEIRGLPEGPAAPPPPASQPASQPQRRPGS